MLPACGASESCIMENLLCEMNLRVNQTYGPKYTEEYITLPSVLKNNYCQI